MNELPSIWRTELWHPRFVHFPIVCLILAALTGIIACLVRRKHFSRAHLRFTTSFLLYCGIALFWITFYTGKLAYSVEVRKICDPTVLKDHLLWAYIAGIVFSFAAIIDIFARIWPVMQKWLMPVIVILMLAGAVFIGYDAHLGASLVYQQGAGIYKPPTGCPGF